jgi:hypothetical protein
VQKRAKSHKLAVIKLLIHMHISLCCLAWDVLLNFDGDERQARTVNISSNKSDARQNMQIK